METENTTKEEAVAVVLEFKPEIFDPKKETLLAIAAEVAKITADPAKMTKEDLELINTTKNKLVKARTSIAKAGKAAREAANKYNKDVKAYEDELIAILEPEELRLKQLESDAKEYAIVQERLKTLPEFKEKLALIGDTVEISDEELLKLDPPARDVYYNQRLGAKLTADKVALDAQKAAQDAAAQKLEDEKKLAQERIFNARVNAILQLGFKDNGTNFSFNDSMIVSREQLELLQDGAFNGWLEEVKAFVSAENTRLAKEAEIKRQADIKAAEEAAAAKAKKEAEQEAAAKEAKRLADEKAAKEAEAEKQAKEAAEKAEKEAQAEFQQWLIDNSYNADTDSLVEDQDAEGKKTILYRTVSEYRHK
jgi:hypothetical protein